MNVESSPPSTSPSAPIPLTPPRSFLTSNPPTRISMAMSVPEVRGNQMLRPRKPWIRGRKGGEIMNQIPTIELPKPAPDEIGSFSPPSNLSSSLLNGHHFPTNMHPPPPSPTLPVDGGGARGVMWGGYAMGNQQGGHDLVPHSLPTYMDRARVRSRWEGTVENHRLRQNSGIGGPRLQHAPPQQSQQQSQQNAFVGIEISNPYDRTSSPHHAVPYAGGIGSLIEDVGYMGSSPQHRASQDDSGTWGYDVPQTAAGHGVNSNNTSVDISGGGLRDRSISSSSNDDLNGSRGQSTSMSTSLTVFEILESARPGLNLVLNDEEVQGVKESKRMTEEVLRSVGGSVEREVEVEDDGRGEDDEMFEAFTLDLDD